jgi:hypothetical protein
VGLEGADGAEGVGRVTMDVMMYASTNMPETIVTKATVTPILILVDEESGGFSGWPLLMSFGVVILFYPLE